MPVARIDDTLRMYYETHCFAEPWTTPEVVLLVHGIAENSRVWYAWVPPIARRYRVVSPDLRGFGRSSKPPQGYPWSVANFAADLRQLLHRLSVEKVHIVGAKLGGTIALQFAHDYPEVCRSLTLVGGPVKLGGGKSKTADWADMVRQRGVKNWAAATMRGRLGQVPAEMSDWWLSLMAGSSRRVVSEVVAYAQTIDLTGLLPDIRVPALMLSGEGGQLASMDVVKRWQQSMPDCRLVVVLGTSYHIAATDADKCASEFLRFLDTLK